MRRAAGGALALLLLAACSSGGGKAEAPAPAPAAPVTSAPVACPAGPSLPAGATDTVSAPGDFDGDGRPDRLATYRAASAGPWHVRVELASGGAAEADLPATAEGVKALGGARLDVGTADAALAVVGTTADAKNVGLFVLRACRLERVTGAGAPAEFPIRAGGGTRPRAGLACQVPGLVSYSATTTDGQTFQASTVGYLLLANILDEAHRSTSPLGASDPALAAFGAFSCGSLKL